VRSLGAYMNVFSIESFVDRALRRAPRARTPVASALRHLEDPRGGADVRASSRPAASAGRARPAARPRARIRVRALQNLAAYMALAMEVEVERGEGRLRVRRVGRGGGQRAKRFIRTPSATNRGRDRAVHQLDTLEA